MQLVGASSVNDLLPEMVAGVYLLKCYSNLIVRLPDPAGGLANTMC